MKTTVEIPDELFRQAKVQAALQGIPLRELFIRGLQLAMEQPGLESQQQRTRFPLIASTRRDSRLTDEQVAHALDQMAQEDILHDASFV